MDYAADLAFMLADAPNSVTVVCGALTGPAILDEESEMYEHGDGKLEVVGVNRSIVFDPVTFTTLQKAAALTLDGVPYKVREILLQKDGTSRAFLVDP
jgi:hypothetical protein